MQLVFLIALLAVVVYLNRHMFGLSRGGCDWMGADEPGEDGSRKWMCNRHGTIVVTEDGSVPPNCNVDEEN